MDPQDRERRIEVECRASAGTVLEPRRLRLGHVVYDVAEIVDRWHEGPRRAGGATRRYFKVRSHGGSLFLIAVDTRTDDWFLVKAFGPELPAPP